MELCCSNQGQTVALTSTGLVLEWGQLGGGVEAGGGGSLTPQQVQAILSGAVPGGGGAGGKGGAGSPPKELSGLSKRSVERIECGRRHFCVILRGTHAQSCVASGKALSDAVAGRREKFKIKAFSAYGEAMAQGGDRFEALLFTEDGDVVSDIHIDDCMDGSYEGEYISAKSGRCSLWLRLGGAHIVGSPFSVTIAPQVSACLVCACAPRVDLSARGTTTQESRISGAASSFFPRPANGGPLRSLLPLLSSLSSPCPTPPPFRTPPHRQRGSAACLSLSTMPATPNVRPRSASATRPTNPHNPYTPLNNICYLMCSLIIACVLLLQNVFSYNPLNTICYLSGAVRRALDSLSSLFARTLVSRGRGDADDLGLCS